jgi:hypothetical protein
MLSCFVQLFHSTFLVPLFSGTVFKTLLKENEALLMICSFLFLLCG